MALHDLTPQMRTRLGRVERLVGVFLLITGVLMVGVFAYFVRHTAIERGWFLTKVPYYTYVADATGVQVGTQVTMMGFNIGEVTLVDQMPMDPWYATNNYNVFIGFRVRDPYQGYILTDSVVRVGAGDLLGARSLEVSRGRSGLPTVKTAKDQPMLMLSDAFRYEPSLTNRTYAPLEKSKNGFWLPAEEAFPIQQRVTDIANAVNAALPGIFGLTNQVNPSLKNLDLLMLSLRDTLPKVEGLMGDVRGTLQAVDPLLRTPGGIGDLLVPTNLNAQLTTTLSNLNPGSGPIGLTLSNLNLRMTEVGTTLSNVNLQLQSNTNLVRNADLLTRDVASLAVTLETLFKRHWLFRSAYRTNQPESPRPPRRPSRSPKESSPSPSPSPSP